MRTIHTDRYYTSTEHLLKVFERLRRENGFRAGNQDEFEAWKNALRKNLFDITGINQFEKCSPEPQLLETTEMDGYRREKLIIQTEPDIWMPFYILTPGAAEKHGKLPCIIAPHGHGSGGKYSTVGRTDIPAVKDAIDLYHNDYGVKLVKDGYIVFCPDARAFGERREWTKQSDNEGDFMSSTCSQLNHMAISLGYTLTGMWTWDLMRLIDYMETRGDCDIDRIGCAGLSGGGLQTLWLSALDERIRCAVISGYFYGYKDSLLKLSGNCSCNYIPGLWNLADMGDIGALIAPRPLLIETGSRDPLNGERGLVNVTEQVEVTRRAYEALAAGDRLYHHVFDGGHLWHGGKTGEFLERYLKNIWQAA